MNAKFFTATGILVGLIALYVILPAVFGPKETGDFSAYQDERQSGTGWAGLGTVRQIVEDAGYDVRNVGASPHILKDTDPKGTFLIVAGMSIPYAPAETDSLDEFMHDGGTILLLDDQGYGMDFSSKYNVNYLTRPVLDANFSKNQSFVKVQSVLDGKNYKLLFNGPSALKDIDENSTLEKLIVTGNSSYLDLNMDGSIDVADKVGPFNMGLMRRVGNDGGRLIVISDSGWLTNQMILQEENKDFLLQLIKKEMADSIDGRNLVLFDESRRSATKLEVGIYTTERTLLNLLRSLPVTGVILSLGLVLLGIVYLVRLPGRESWVHRFLPKTYVPPPTPREKKDLFLEIMRIKAHLDASTVGVNDPVIASALANPVGVPESDYPQLLQRLAKTMELSVPVTDPAGARSVVAPTPVPPVALSTPAKA